MRVVIDDMIETIHRLNKELDNRVDFERKLVDIIEAKNKEIEQLNDQLAVFAQGEIQRSIKQDIEAQQKLDAMKAMKEH